MHPEIWSMNKMLLTIFMKVPYELKHQYLIKKRQGFGGEHFAYANKFANT